MTSVDRDQREARIGYWSIKCAGGGLDVYGDRKSPKRCFAQYYPPRSPLYGNSTVFEVTANGPQLAHGRRKASLCNSSAKRIAVDGKRIDHLSPAEQVARVVAGSQFAREDNGAWPECGVVNNVTTLERGPEAFAAMMDLWADFSR